MRIHGANVGWYSVLYTVVRCTQMKVRVVYSSIEELYVLAL